MENSLQKLFFADMSSKMPSLNRDILEEIVPYFNHWNMNDKKEAAAALKAFMLSGKEPYDAVLRHFSHVYGVLIGSDALWITINRHVLKRNCGCNIYVIPYNFSMFDNIMKILVESNARLVIKAYPACNAGRKAFARLTQKHLKHVRFDDNNKFPADYYKFFQNECSFDSVRLKLCFANKALLSDFLKLSSTGHIINTHFGLFFQKLRATKFVFSSVENLIFYPCNCQEPFEDFPFDFVTTKGMQDFLSLVVESFPNLEHLDAEFSAIHGKPMISNAPTLTLYRWEIVYNEMIKFSPELFKHIPLHVKGSLTFYYSSIREPMNIVTLFLPKKNCPVEIDKATKRLIRKFDIHDGLTFEFFYQLGEEKFVPGFDDHWF